MAIEIKYATKTGRGNRHEDIVAIGNNVQSWTLDSAIEWIENRYESFYVEVGLAAAPIRVVNGPAGKYLRTEKDGEEKDNLLWLPPFVAAF